MDCIFSKRELSWLDDLMPESKKKKLEDADEVMLLSTKCPSQHVTFTEFHQYSNTLTRCLYQCLKEEEEQSIVAEEDGVVQVPLEGYK